jgi:ATP-dependent metalloprotease FtsH
MADGNSSDPKKAFSNSFVWFLLGAILLVMMVQNMLDSSAANVSFSYQLEHLVNEELIQPEDSKKTALNDNLVSFSGKFKEHLSEEGKNRYKYLELLNAHNELKTDQERIKEELNSLKSKVIESSDYFLKISGIAIPKGGYAVVEDNSSSYPKDSSIYINQTSTANLFTLKNAEENFAQLKESSDPEALKKFSSELQDLVNEYRSSNLGIGNESMKQSLKTLSADLKEKEGADLTREERMALYENTLASLQSLTVDLNTLRDSTRLYKLRSVRNYKDALEEYNRLSGEIEDNQMQLDKARLSVINSVWFFNNKELTTRTLEKQDPELFHQWFLNAKEEWNSFPNNKGKVFKAPDQPLNLVLEKTFKSEEPSPNYLSYLFTFLPVLLVLLFLYFIFSKQMKGVGTNAMNFGKSPARLMTKDKNKITFKDVAGIDEALEELEEIVEFLKNPQKFTALGGHIPKGVLCVGPPGTGKTLIAKAVAGEADRPFFSISGSDFVEMFVGVGASRIRDLFNQAKQNAPCIIFMDEIDAVGRHRGAGIGGGHDEREQTLNQLLVEMDGFDTNEGVILIAATNRPDVLDKALLRPGRFDRRIIINLPDIKGRFEILKVHAKKIKMDTSVDLMTIAKSTPGCSGADLGNLLNEAALLAARKNRNAVTMQDINEARDKVLYGKERKSLEMDADEKKTTAYHESGHTIVALSLEHADPVDKVTIIPRGMSLGSTMFLPEKNRVGYWKNELHHRLAVLMGGRCAEEIFVKDVSSGARQDFVMATGLARSMVCEWGMSDKLGPVTYDERSDSGYYLGMSNYHERNYSESTAKEIDAEVKNLLDKAHQKAYEIITQCKEQVELMTQMLIEFETLDAEDVKKILKGEWKSEDKKDKMKLQEDLHKKPQPTKAQPPPPPPVEAAALGN